MSAHENFKATTESLASTLLALAIKFNAIKCPGEKKSMPDGSKVVINEHGEVVYVDYAEGSKVMRFSDYVMCTSRSNEHWFRTSTLSWFRLD
ncbi:hypothetical protein BH10CYA1_BH10CYA1_34790 [soil metagenome]